MYGTNQIRSKQQLAGLNIYLQIMPPPLPLEAESEAGAGRGREPTYGRGARHGASDGGGGGDTTRAETNLMLLRWSQLSVSYSN